MKTIQTLNLIINWRQQRQQQQQQEEEETQQQSSTAVMTTTDEEDPTVSITVSPPPPDSTTTTADDTTTTTATSSDETMSSSSATAATVANDDDDDDLSPDDSDIDIIELDELDASTADDDDDDVEVDKHNSVHNGDDEDDDDDDDDNDDQLSTASLCSSSVVSQVSDLSFLRDQYLRQHLLSPNDSLNEDLSETSSLNYRELTTEVQLKRGTRAYVHTRNSGLNGKLNLVLILSLSAVIGLGIGHFIGWSNNRHHQHRHLSMGQVIKLKQLQDELVVCMDNQQITGSHQTNGQSALVCHSDGDYFRQKFETLFSENKYLLDAFERTQQHYHSDGDLRNIIADKECDNETAGEEFHKLKLGFLVTQMEHLQLLKTLEEVKSKGKQSEQRVKDLEEENSELKMKLVEEEEDDQQIVESWGNRVAILETENQELRTRLEDDEEEDSVVLKRLNDKIDELMQENEELKAAINQLEAQVVNVVGHTISAGEEEEEAEGVSISSQSSRIDHNIRNGGSGGARDNGADIKMPVKLDLLKQRINQMIIENDELKSTIGRLRWTTQEQPPPPPSSDDDLIDEEDIDDETKYVNSIVDDYSSSYSSNELAEELLAQQLEEQLTELKDQLISEQLESKKWRQMYESLKKTEKSDNSNTNNGNSKNQKTLYENTNYDDFVDDDDNVLYDWVMNSTNMVKEALVTGSGIVSDKLKTLYTKMTSENESFIPSEVFAGLNITHSVLQSFNRRLHDKWQELQDMKFAFTSTNGGGGRSGAGSDSGGSGHEKVANKMARLFQQTVRKLREAGNRLLSKEEKLRTRVDQFAARIAKVIDKMDNKWNQLLDKLAKRYSKNGANSGSGGASASDNDDGSDKKKKGDDEEKINWFFERANSRRQQHQQHYSFTGTTGSEDIGDGSYRAYRRESYHKSRVNNGKVRVHININDVDGDEDDSTADYQSVVTDNYDNSELKGDFETIIDNDDDVDDDNDNNNLNNNNNNNDNWFLKKSRKPRMASFYDWDGLRANHRQYRRLKHRSNGRRYHHNHQFGDETHYRFYQHSRQR
ncbi:bromodomain and WD repeat-containing DDB_G0285837-like isoform X2 [Oppia nitens]|uniref:bromodomain and WD repeat-containing DDB_G0285837-like isoform X2 n=1 Tax=Oppia nitens TaxID=1686743 RepID=UPI0023DABD0D|nr:bromodomain and WD repeat-containing DDB_G0285837-like isoform X2 [Oppia nitens]